MITVIVHGRLAADCEVLLGKSGKDFVKFTVASDTMYNIKETIYVKCIYSRSVVAPMLQKGREVIVYGILRPDNWVDKEGRKHYDIYVSVEKLTLIKKESNTEKEEPIKISPVAVDDVEFDAEYLF